MFQLPVCPYCNAVYHYKEVKQILKEKTHKCYHCNKNFNVEKLPGTAVLWSIVIIFAILINVSILMVMTAFNIIPLLMISFFAAVLGFILIPYFTGFKKENKNLKK